MRKPVLILGLALLFGALVVAPAAAQAYSFQIPEEAVDVYLEPDGSMRLVYRILFANDSGAPPIDFVDVGLPSQDYPLSSVRAWIDGQPISSIETSPYVDPGIALGLGAAAIPGGDTGEVVVEIPRVGRAGLRPAAVGRRAPRRPGSTKTDGSSTRGGIHHPTRSPSSPSAPPSHRPTFRRKRCKPRSPASLPPCRPSSPESPVAPSPCCRSCSSSA
jgi:hypothetical protein